MEEKTPCAWAQGVQTTHSYTPRRATLRAFGAPAVYGTGFPSENLCNYTTFLMECQWLYLNFAGQPCEQNSEEDQEEIS